MTTTPMHVQTACARLAEAEALLTDARSAHMQATRALLGTQPIWIDGVRYGGLNPLDEYLSAAIALVVATQPAYDAAFAQYQQALAQYQQATDTALLSGSATPQEN